MKLPEGMTEMEISEVDLKFDPESDGVWIKDEVFLPRNVVLWAFHALAAGGAPGAMDVASEGKGAGR